MILIVSLLAAVLCFGALMYITRRPRVDDSAPYPGLTADGSTDNYGSTVTNSDSAGDVTIFDSSERGEQADSAAAAEVDTGSWGESGDSDFSSDSGSDSENN